MSYQDLLAEIKNVSPYAFSLRCTENPSHSNLLVLARKGNFQSDLGLYDCSVFPAERHFQYALHGLKGEAAVIKFC